MQTYSLVSVDDAESRQRCMRKIKLDAGRRSNRCAWVDARQRIPDGTAWLNVNVNAKGGDAQ